MTSETKETALDLEAVKAHLERVDRGGGLGYDAHDAIRDAIALLAALSRAPVIHTETEAYAKERQILRFLTKRADWLKSEYLNGGDYEHLSTREKEVRYIIEKISRNRLD